MPAFAPGLEPVRFVVHRVFMAQVRNGHWGSAEPLGPVPLRLRLVHNIKRRMAELN